MQRINRVFVDTSAFVALYDKADDRHLESIRVFKEIKSKRIRIVVTDYILSESITIAMARGGHRTAVTVGEFILGSQVVDLIWLDKPLKLRAWEYFKKHSDKSYSFTDCTSFVVMKEMKIKHFFAFDDDFTRAGFIHLY